MTNGDGARAKLLLDFADNRYAEVAGPAARTPARSTRTPPRWSTSTLSDADSDVKQAMQALGAQAIKNSSGKGYGLLLGWADGPAQGPEEVGVRAAVQATCASRSPGRSAS